MSDERLDRTAAMRWNDPGRLCRLGEDRPLTAFGGDGREKLGRRFALQVSTQNALNRKINWILEWAGDELGLRRSSGWRELLRALRPFLRSFFQEGSDYGGWISIERWRVVLRNRLPQLRKAQGIIGPRAIERGGWTVLQTFDRRLCIPRELFLGPEKRLHRDDPLVNLLARRFLVDPMTGRRLFHSGSWWTSAEPTDHKALLRSEQVPVTRMFYDYDSGIVMTHLISFLRLANSRLLENYTLELNPGDGRLTSVRLSRSELAMHLIMQPNDYQLLEQAIASRNHRGLERS